MSARLVAPLVLALLATLALERVAAAQAPPDVPAASPAPSPPVPVLPAATIPASLALTVTGVPAIDADVLDAQVRAALDRAIRPTLRPGSAVRYGPIVPWPLLPLPAGERAAVNVTVSVEGDASSSPVQGVTTVFIDNVVVAPAPPRVLFLSDDPEYLQNDGLVFRGDVTAARPARLYYYHSAIGIPRDLDVVLTAAAPARVHLIASGAGPDLDVLAAGHTVSRDLVRFEQANAGIVVDLVPGTPFVVRHGLVLQGEVVAGAVDVAVVRGGPVGVSVVSALAGSRPETFLNGPRLPFDGHQRHGTFDLEAFGALERTYTVGGPDVAVQYGSRASTPQNIIAGDAGRDYGDYGVVHRITFTLVNPTDTPAAVYLYEKPLGGPVRSSFFVDGRLHELGCARLQQPYWVTTYQLAPHATGASTTLTMTDGGSFYPLEYGVTATTPLPYTPPAGSAEGCSPSVTPFADPGGAPARKP